MAWRRDEIWLDTEMLWSREVADGIAASLALRGLSLIDLAPAGATPVAAYGLAELRRRRAELRRRRSARKTRAAAFVVGPAMALGLAGPRAGNVAHGGAALPEDPPSLTDRPGAPAGAAGAQTRRKRPVEREPAFPKVDWRRATSHGLPYAGRLAEGTQLPPQGPDWVTWNPVRDRVPNAAHRLYGHERTIRRILSIVAAYRAAHPDAPRVVVGDISFRGGGPMELHRSHQNGLDVDVYYPRLDGSLRTPARASQIDRQLAQELVDRFVAAGAEKVFVGYSTGLRGPSRVVVPYPNHEDHMHVRFRPPAD